MTSDAVTADLQKKPAEIQAMFDGIAKRYDLMNTLQSGGQDRRWRRLTREALQLRKGERVLDLAAGTGVSSVELSRSGAYVVGADLSIGMLSAGMRTDRVRESGVPLLAADALHLPFADNVFDAVTISYGLRNIGDADGALREMARVVRPGGRLAIAEFSTPLNDAFRKVYFEYLIRGIPLIANRVAANPDAYHYLADSIRAWPDQAGLAAQIAASGWGQVQWRNLTGGIVAIHRAVRS